MEFISILAVFIVLAIYVSSSQVKRYQTEHKLFLKMLAFLIREQKSILETKDGSATVQLLRVKRNLRRMLSQIDIAKYEEELEDYGIVRKREVTRQTSKKVN